MSGNERRVLPAVRGGTAIMPGEPRTIGIQVGGTIYMPALPADANDAAALRGAVNAHVGAVIAMDRFYAAAAAFAAPRVVISNPGAEIEAQREEEKELKHQRLLAEKRRERELIDADVEIMDAEHRAEAKHLFKESKYKAGFARFDEMTAKRRVGEAVARASMEEEILEPERKPAEKPKSASTAEMLAQVADDLEKQIDNEEAAGRPTDQLRSELKSINALLRRELLKSAGR